MYVHLEQKTNFEEEENFLISRIQSTSETDPVQSKCWQLFAKSLYPQSPTIIHQLYKEAYKEKDLNESSQYFGQLIEKLPDSVSEELKSIVEALHSNSESFIKEIFDHLPDTVKCKVMLMATSNAPCIAAHCELVLLFLKQMPYPKLHEHVYNVIDSLLSAEEASKIPIPVNYYRKMLVCDALPLILQMSQFDYKPEFMLKLLQKAVEFYITCIFKPSTSDFEIINSVNLSSKGPNKNWEPLLKLFETVAIRYRWNNPEMYGSEFNEKSLFQLLSVLKKKNEILKHMIENNTTIPEDIPGIAEAFFCLCLTFFYYFESFARHIFHKNTSNLFEGHSSYFLMEGISVPQNCCLKKLGPELKHEEKGIYYF
ncbi:integrator complex subunit 10 [Caerostris extrusa]|uniref:Integrator complex subunit 10 n=1 Tax=Caerostris extrusa TaxID=172846 RepID=A0AAV4QGW4_CAEEX|nr:integrator complex subunit 10 [Caerostris extrusa]